MADKRFIIQVIFTIIMMLAIGALLFTTITIYKYREMLQNPLAYNMKKFDLAYCTCYNNRGTIIPIDAGTNKTLSAMVAPQPEYAPVSFNKTFNWSS